jgi:hypothetical protein
MAASMEEMRQRVEAEIEPSERLLWTGSPDPARWAAGGIPAMLFGIPFTLFALFWMAMAGGISFLSSGIARQTGGPGFATPFMFFPLFGLIFVAVGLGLLLSPLWAYLKAQRTIYAITDRRAITLEENAFGSRSVRSFGPDEISLMERRENANGIGDLVFSRERYNTYRNGRHRSHLRENGFFAIPDARSVERILREAFLGGGYR